MEPDGHFQRGEQRIRGDLLTGHSLYSTWRRPGTVSICSFAFSLMAADLIEPDAAPVVTHQSLTLALARGRSDGRADGGDGVGICSKSALALLNWSLLASTTTHG